MNIGLPFPEVRVEQIHGFKKKSCVNDKIKYKISLKMKLIIKFKINIQIKIEIKNQIGNRSEKEIFFFAIVP